MCFKSQDREQDPASKSVERKDAPPEKLGPGMKTHPRGNGPREERDLERSVEMLSAVLGR
jgi:hypothetical protein